MKEIDAHLGLRCRLSGYQYGEIVQAMMCNFLCGGDRTEDINRIREGVGYGGVRLCSPDTALRIFSELSVDDTLYTSVRGIQYRFNTAELLNGLLVRFARPFENARHLFLLGVRADDGDVDVSGCLRPFGMFQNFPFASTALTADAAGRQIRAGLKFYDTFSYRIRANSHYYTKFAVAFDNFGEQREDYLPVKREKKMHQNGVICTDPVPRLR
ncbi:MAG: hypothetical protein IKH26_08090 [Bacteroidaceae bacterium]|nr:hypothetical protein [Bacteroidaceae bacterium]